MMQSNDDRKDFDQAAFRQAFTARMDNNLENNEWNRRRRWMMSSAPSLNDRQPIMTSRPPLVYNNSTTATSPDAVNHHTAINNERSNSTKISSMDISSPAKRNLWLLGQRYSSSSSSSSFGDAQSVAGSSSSSSSFGTRSIPGPVSPPSLRSKRIGNLHNYDPVQMLLLHANRYDSEVNSVGRNSVPSSIHEDQNMPVQGGHLNTYNPVQMLLLHANRYVNNEVESVGSDGTSSIHEDHNVPVQGGHLLQLLNQLARSNDNAQPTQSPPIHLDVTLDSSSDDDDGTSMLSNVSSFISPTLVSRGDSEISEIGIIEEDEEDSQVEESDCFSSVLSELDQDENTLQSSPSVVKDSKDGDDDLGLLSCIALSILAVVSILLALSGLFSLQAKIDNWKESMAIRFWETIKKHGTIGLEELKELYSYRNSMVSALLHNWEESMTRHLSGMMERCEALYLNTLNDLLRQRHLICASFSLSNVASFSTQQLERITTRFNDMDVTTVALEQFYRLAKVYYSAIELFKSAQISFVDLQASTGLTWNTTLLAASASESLNWLITPLSYSTQDQFSISKSSLTMPVVINVGIGLYSNETIQYQEDDEIQYQEDEIQIEAKEMPLHNTSLPFWRPQPRAFIKHICPVPDSVLRTRPSIKHIEDVGHSLVVSEDLTAMVIKRMKRNSKQQSKPKKKQKKVRDYYDSVIQQKQSVEYDVFDGVDVMSMASDAILGWWQQHR